MKYTHRRKRNRKAGRKLQSRKIGGGRKVYSMRGGIGIVSKTAVLDNNNEKTVFNRIDDLIKKKGTMTYTFDGDKTLEVEVNYHKQSRESDEVDSLTLTCTKYNNEQQETSDNWKQIITDVIKNIYDAESIEFADNVISDIVIFDRTGLVQLNPSQDPKENDNILRFTPKSGSESNDFENKVITYLNKPLVSKKRTLGNNIFEPTDNDPTGLKKSKLSTSLDLIQNIEVQSPTEETSSSSSVVDANPAPKSGSPQGVPDAKSVAGDFSMTKDDATAALTALVNATNRGGSAGAKISKPEGNEITVNVPIKINLNNNPITTGSFSLDDKVWFFKDCA